ncbi:coiled-coil domain-containing protein 117-like isoform X2 [Polyodon spathula]|uniref:coiled-coil domain-containing protein 117-like isoform X2 n=1 Tax=Polyodon spathula TaxID=7913 RepID=UPI001B7F69B6|nr:coiled-coil domain-containing protein 117-like isoform X2 [Polyodon spathula]
MSGGVSSICEDENIKTQALNSLTPGEENVPSTMLAYSWPTIGSHRTPLVPEDLNFQNRAAEDCFKSGDPGLNAQLFTKHVELNELPIDVCYGNNKKRKHSDVGMVGQNFKTIKINTVSSSPDVSCERRYQRKHKREHDEETATPRKRQATEEMVSASFQAPSFLPEGVAPQHCWGDLSANPQQPAELEGQAAHMEVEGRESMKHWGAAHRRLQEIEDSIIVEDDDEDLETASTNSSFPVLVMSDTLREGLKQGLGDVIPRKLAQSVNHSCMEMVIWRPPEDVLCSKQRESMERLRHSTGCSPVAEAPVLKDRDSELQQHLSQTPVYRDLSQHSCTEEDMEL